MEELKSKELELVQGGMDSGLCTALVVGGSSLVGGVGAGYFSLGMGFSGGASAGAFFGGFLAAAVCYK